MRNTAFEVNLMPSITKKCSQPLASTKERRPAPCRIERTSPQTQHQTPAHAQEVMMMEAVSETGPKQYGPLLLPLITNQHNLAYIPYLSSLHRRHELVLHLLYLLIPKLPRPGPAHNLQQPHRPLDLPQALQSHPRPRNFIHQSIA